MSARVESANSSRDADRAKYDWSSVHHHSAGRSRLTPDLDVERQGHGDDGARHRAASGSRSATASSTRSTGRRPARRRSAISASSSPARSAGSRSSAPASTRSPSRAPTCRCPGSCTRAKATGWSSNSLPDPLRDVVLVSFRLDRRGHAALCRCWRRISATAAWTIMPAPARTFRPGKATMRSASPATAGSRGRARAMSVISDGWQDFAAERAHDLDLQRGAAGNVALFGELAANEGTLALGFAETPGRRAHTLARSSLSEGYGAIRATLHRLSGRRGGKSWSSPTRRPTSSARPILSAVVLKMHEDRTYPGSIVASLSVPWGNRATVSGGYHLVWARDCVEAGLALVAVGQVERCAMDAGLSHRPRRPTTGSWNAELAFPTGAPFWTGIQLDEVGFPVVARRQAHARRTRSTGMSGIEAMIRRAVRYLVAERSDQRAGPLGRERRHQPVHAGHRDRGADRRRRRSSRRRSATIACRWRTTGTSGSRTGPTYEGGPFAAQYGVDGYYVRIGPHRRPTTSCADASRSRTAGARRSSRRPSSAWSFSTWFAWDCATPDDPAHPEHAQGRRGACSRSRRRTAPPIAATMATAMASTKTAARSTAPASAVLWPLLAGERGHFDLLLGLDPLPYLETMARMTGPGRTDPRAGLGRRRRCRRDGL